MPRFVLLYHDCPPHYERLSHWDLMLETGGELRTWAVARLPNKWDSVQRQTAEMFSDCAATSTASSVSVERLADHRLDYLQLEGPLSGDRGSVARIDSGTFENETEQHNHWQVSLDGRFCGGRIVLQQSEDEPAQWTLSVRPI